MAWQVRVDGTIIETLEIKSIKWGYAFPRECTLFYPGPFDEGPSTLTNNQLIEISTDGFVTLVFKGYLVVNSPQGIRSDGVSYAVMGLEHAANRFITKFNSSVEYVYNIDNLPDYNSPNDTGGRWTVGQIMVDVLEHAIGIPVAGSDISKHHPSGFSATGTYMPAASLNTYTAADLLALDLELGELRVVAQRFWDFLQSLIHRMDNHGIYIDPSDPANPTFVVHDYTTSSAVNLTCGQVGTHIVDTEATPGSALVVDNPLNFDITKSRTKIIIEGRGTVQELKPYTQGGSIDAATMVPHWEDGGGEEGKQWIIWDPQTYTPFLNTIITSNGLLGPVLVVDGVVCHEDWADWHLETGVVTTPQDLSGKTVEVWTNYLALFQVTAGPGGDAYDNYDLVSELAFYDDRLIHPSQPICEKYNLISTFNQGTFYSCAYAIDSEETMGEEYCAPQPSRDDTSLMQAIANAILAYWSDERIDSTVTIDGIDLSTYTLLKMGNFTGLTASRWSAINAQIIEMTVFPNEDRMVFRLTNDVFRVPQFAEWKRRLSLHADRNTIYHMLGRIKHRVKVGGDSVFERL